MFVGRKESVAFEVGSRIDGSPDLRTVDIWLDGLRATYFDNSAYLPSFLYALSRELASLSVPGQRNHKKIASAADARKFYFKRRRPLDRNVVRYEIFSLGETTDDVRAFAFTHDDNVFIVFTLRLNSKRHVISMSIQELKSTIENAISACKSA
jgi:hypothetical protein